MDKPEITWEGLFRFFTDCDVSHMGDAAGVEIDGFYDIQAIVDAHNDAILKAKNDAYEESAVIADRWKQPKRPMPEYSEPYRPFQAADDIAQAIRNLKHEGER